MKRTQEFYREELKEPCCICQGAINQNAVIKRGSLHYNQYPSLHALIVTQVEDAVEQMRTLNRSQQMTADENELARKDPNFFIPSLPFTDEPDSMDDDQRQVVTFGCFHFAHRECARNLISINILNKYEEENNGPPLPCPECRRIISNDYQSFIGINILPPDPYPINVKKALEIGDIQRAVEKATRFIGAHDQRHAFLEAYKLYINPEWEDLKEKLGFVLYHMQNNFNEIIFHDYFQIGYEYQDWKFVEDNLNTVEPYIRNFYDNFSEIPEKYQTKLISFLDDLTFDINDPNYKEFNYLFVYLYLSEDHQKVDHLIQYKEFQFALAAYLNNSIVGLQKVDAFIAQYNRIFVDDLNIRKSLEKLYLLATAGIGKTRSRQVYELLELFVIILYHPEQFEEALEQLKNHFEYNPNNKVCLFSMLSSYTHIQYFSRIIKEFPDFFKEVQSELTFIPIDIPLNNLLFLDTSLENIREALKNFALELNDTNDPEGLKRHFIELQNLQGGQRKHRISKEILSYLYGHPVESGWNWEDLMQMVSRMDPIIQSEIRQRARQLQTGRMP